MRCRNIKSGPNERDDHERHYSLTYNVQWNSFAGYSVGVQRTISSVLSLRF